MPVCLKIIDSRGNNVEPIVADEIGRAFIEAWRQWKTPGHDSGCPLYELDASVDTYGRHDCLYVVDLDDVRLVMMWPYS